MVPDPAVELVMSYVPVTAEVVLPVVVLMSSVPVIVPAGEDVSASVRAPEVSRTALVGGLKVPSIKLPLTDEEVKGPVDCGSRRQKNGFCAAMLSPMQNASLSFIT